MERIYQNAENSDLQIRVEGTVFNVHSFIVRARSKVFDAMMTHDCIERRNRVIYIKDFDANVINTLLLFLYTGRTEELSFELAYNLYFAADKYNVLILRDICSNYLKRKVTIPTISDIICVACMHDDRELLMFAAAFLRKNFQEIITSRFWRAFRRNNPTMITEINKIL